MPRGLHRMLCSVSRNSPMAYKTERRRGRQRSNRSQSTVKLKVTITSVSRKSLQWPTRQREGGADKGQTAGHHQMSKWRPLSKVKLEVTVKGQTGGQSKVKLETTVKGPSRCSNSLGQEFQLAGSTVLTCWVTSSNSLGQEFHLTGSRVPSHWVKSSNSLGQEF